MCVPTLSILMIGFLYLVHIIIIWNTIKLVNISSLVTSFSILNVPILDGVLIYASGFDVLITFQNFSGTESSKTADLILLTNCFNSDYTHMCVYKMRVLRSKLWDWYLKGFFLLHWRSGWLFFVSNKYWFYSR